LELSGKVVLAIQMLLTTCTQNELFIEKMLVTTMHRLFS